MTSLVENKKEKKALDLGCGGGRNSLFLAENGFDVLAFDKNMEAVMNLNMLAQKNNLNLKAEVKDLNNEQISTNFDVIIATVSLQFLENDSAKKLIKSAIEHTNN